MADHVKKMLDEAAKSGNEALALRQKQAAFAMIINSLSPKDLEVYVCCIAQLISAEERLQTMDPTLPKLFREGELTNVVAVLDSMQKHINAHLSDIREAMKRGVLTP